MHSVAPRVVAVAFLFSGLAAVAAPPTPPPKPATAAPDTTAGLRDQLIASVRADIAGIKRGKQEDAAGIERLTQAIDLLARESDIVEGRRPPASQYSEQRTAGLSWVAVVQAHGSEKSAALASRLNSLQLRERAAAETALLDRAEAVGKRVGAAALQAKTSKEIDPLLVEIAELTAPFSQGRYYAAGGGGVFQQVAALTQFVTNWQNFLVLVEAGRQAEALQALRNLGGSGRETPWIPRSELTRQLGEAARRAGKPTPEEIAAQVTALVEKGLAAETAEAIDPQLAAARKLQTLLQNEDSGQAGYRISAVVTFLERWQDFHMARATGNAAKLREILSQLNNYEVKQLDLPRSKLLERIYALSGPAADGDTADARKTTRPKTAGSEKIEKPDAVLARILKLEDLDGNFEALKRAATLEGGQSYPQPPWQSVISELNNIQREYQQLKSGMAVRMTLALTHGENLMPQVAVLRQELACFAIQRLVGDDAKLAPQGGENSLTYLRRVLAAARERADWRLVQRVLEMGQSTGVQDPVLKASDTTAFTAFLAGMTQERARQFPQAVLSYQNALKTGSELLPVEDIGARLERIKKEHPADFEQGVVWTINPIQRDQFGRPLPYDVRAEFPKPPADREKPILVPEKKPTPEAAPEPPKSGETKPPTAKPAESAPTKP